MSGVRNYQVPAGVYGNTQPFSGSGQVIMPTNGLDLTGVSVLIDSLSAAPIVWPQGLYALDLGAPFSQFWLVGTIASGGNLLVGPCGFKPRATSIPNPAAVSLPVVANTPVVAADGQTALIAGGYDSARVAYPLLVDTSGALVAALSTGGGNTTPLINTGQASSGAFTAGVAVGGFSKFSSAGIGYNVAIAAGTRFTIPCPGGIWGQWKRVSIKLNLTTSSGNLALQFSAFDEYEDDYEFCLSGAAGAGLPAARYIFTTDGLTAVETLGTAPSIVRPVHLPSLQGNGIYVLNTSATVGEVLQSGYVCVDNF